MTLNVNADLTSQLCHYRGCYKLLQLEGEYWLRTGLFLLRFYRSHQENNLLPPWIFSNTIILPLTQVPTRIAGASREAWIAPGPHRRPHEGTQIYDWKISACIFHYRCSR